MLRGGGDSDKEAGSLTQRQLKQRAATRLQVHRERAAKCERRQQHFRREMSLSGSFSEWSTAAETTPVRAAEDTG